MHRLLAALLVAISITAVEVPATVTKVVDGDTIVVALGDKTEAKVRLLYVDTPESRGNAHGEAMAEGVKAAEFLRGRLPVGTTVKLWGPKDALDRDPYDRLLAVPWRMEAAVIGAGGTAASPADLEINVCSEIIRAGWSPYWKKYGKAPDRLDAAFAAAHAEAKEAGAGAWSTAPDYMRDKANETTAPRMAK